MEAFNILPDPQTNGGLLIAVSPGSVEEVQRVLNDFGLADFTEPIGMMTAAQEKVVTVTNGPSV
jgi:selenide,water dikinase